MPILSDYLSTGLVAKFPTLIVLTVLMSLSFFSFFCGVILTVLKKQHRQNFERNLNLLRYMYNKNIDKE